MLTNMTLTNAPGCHWSTAIFRDSCMITVQTFLFLFIYAFAASWHALLAVTETV